MYCGESNSAVDESGRVRVPLHFKSLMKALNHDTWHVTRGSDGALLLFPEKLWNELVERLTPPVHAEESQEHLDFRRMFLGCAARVNMDAKGRLNIPALLREYAGIDREAVILGMGNHLEIWRVKGWKAFQESQAESYKKMAAELFGGLCGRPGQCAE